MAKSNTLTIWVQTGPQRPATVRITHADTIKLGDKAVTLPSISVVFQPAWIGRKKAPDGGTTPDYGPDYLVLENQPAGKIAALKTHPDFGSDWLRKLDKHLEDRAADLGIERMDKIPSRPIERTFKAEDLETMKEAFAIAGMELPQAFHEEPGIYVVPDSAAVQGTLGTGGQPTKTAPERG